MPFTRVKYQNLGLPIFCRRFALVHKSTMMLSKSLLPSSCFKFKKPEYLTIHDMYDVLLVSPASDGVLK